MTDISERIDISEHTQAICKLLGYDPDNVAHLDIYPGRVTVTCFELNEHGSKFVHTEGPLVRIGKVAIAEPVEIFVRT